jgi:HK97 family phage major capsid protein
VVEIAKGAAAVIAPLCQNFAASGLTMRVPTMAAVTAVTASEGAAVTEANPTVGNVMMILTKLGAQIVLSDELFSDSAFNVMEIAGRRVGEGIGVLEDTQILTTNGTSPNITGALVGGAITEATATELGYYDLATLFFAVGKAYHANGTWIAGSVVASLLTNLVSGGRQLVQPLPLPIGPVTDVVMPTAIGTIFGRPVYHCPAATAGDLIFGDLRSYGWVKKGGIEAKVSTDTGWAADTIAFKFTQRCDGQLLDAVGIKELQGLTTAA